MDLLQNIWSLLHGRSSTPAATTEPRYPYDANKILPLSDWKWTQDGSWNEYLDSLRVQAANMRMEADFDDGYFGTASVQRAQSWLRQRHPPVHDDIKTSSIERFNVKLVAHDEEIVVHIITVIDYTEQPENPTILALVAAVEQHKAWPGREDRTIPRPGDMLESDELMVAKKLVYDWATTDNTQHVTTHAVIYVQIGADMVACEPRPDIREPKVFPRSSPEMTEEDISTNQECLDNADNANVRGMFNWLALQSWVEEVVKKNEIVWDEGEVKFGSSEQYTARLLSTRRVSWMRAKGGFRATHFLVKMPNTAPDRGLPPQLVFKMLDAAPECQPDGVHTLAMHAALDPNLLWPVPGLFLGTAAIEAAEQALMEKAMQMHRQGIFRNAVLKLYMGVDIKEWMFVGRGLLSSPSPRSDTSATAHLQAAPDGQAAELFGDLTFDGFDEVTFHEQPTSLLYDDDGSFQARHDSYGWYTRELFQDRGLGMRVLAAIGNMRDVYPVNPLSMASGRDRILNEPTTPYEQQGPRSEDDPHLFILRCPAPSTKVQWLYYLPELPQGMKPKGTFDIFSPEVREACDTMATVIAKVQDRDEMCDDDFVIVIDMFYDVFYWKLGPSLELLPYTVDELVRLQNRAP